MQPSTCLDNFSLWMLTHHQKSQSAFPGTHLPSSNLCSSSRMQNSGLPKDSHTTHPHPALASRWLLESDTTALPTAQAHQGHSQTIHPGTSTTLQNCQTASLMTRCPQPLLSWLHNVGTSSPLTSVQQRPAPSLAD